MKKPRRRRKVVVETQEDVKDYPPSLFHRLVYKIVIQERRGISHRVADSLNISYGAFYNRMIGRADFNPEQINLLLRELADPRLCDCLLSGTGIDFRLTKKWGNTDLEALQNALTFATETVQALNKDKSV
jgi:hypothetical protein